MLKGRTATVVLLMVAAETFHFFYAQMDDKDPKDCKIRALVHYSALMNIVI